MGSGKRSKAARRLMRQVKSETISRKLPDATVAPGGTGPLDFMQKYSADATGTDNIPVESGREQLAETPSGLVDKYLLRGRRAFPFLEIVFLAAAVSIFWIIIQDSTNGFIKAGDWTTILWTLLKCGLPFSLFLFLWLSFNIIFTWFRKK